MGIGYATSNRGACHLRGYTPASEVVGNVLGQKSKSDPISWQGKAEMIMIFQNVYGFTDSLNLCKFGTFAIPLDVYAALYSAVTGVPLDAGGALELGERIYNLERYYNNINGFREGSDYLPKRFLVSLLPGQYYVCDEPIIGVAASLKSRGHPCLAD